MCYFVRYNGSDLTARYARKDYRRSEAPDDGYKLNPAT